MRVNILKIFALFLFLSLTGAAFGQPYLLMSMTTNVWKYNQTGNNLGSVWRTAAYDDTATGWQSGKGVLAFETDNAIVLPQVNTVLQLSNGTTRITTYYFRTHFNLTNDPYRVNVLITNLIDDGAVFYVNGVEVNRFTMPLAPAPITYVTTATAAIEAGYQTFTIPYDVLVQGDNLIAAEVHNASSTSSDIVFGLAASVVNPAATSTLVITNQPRSISSGEGAPVSFTAGVSGFPILYAQWFFNSNAIPGANRLTYTINSVDITNAGTYTLSISNASSGLLTTTPATLTVLADTNGPVILAADGTDSPTNIVVTFNERILPITATNLANYVITNIGSALSFSPTKATLAPNGSNVTLVTSVARLANTNYLLVVNNVRDAAPRNNLIAPGSAFPISSTISLADELSFYYLYNPVLQFGDNPQPTNIWKTKIAFNPYNDDKANAWSDNDFQRGIAWYSGNDLPGPQGFHLSQSDLTTPAYFVLPIDFKASPLGSSLMVSYIIDDGGIFYLNGTEFLRVGLPNGPVTYQTSASRAIYPPSWVGPVSTNLPFVAGLNNLAVELHTASTLDTNYDFAIRVSADISSYAVGPVVITRHPTNTTVYEGQSATFSFYGAGPNQFQWYQNNVLIPGATNPTYTISFVTTNMNTNLFKVMASNGSSSATSSNAVLTVLNDTNAPSLVSAYCISSNQILVSFSEALSTASAQNIANYTITNRLAANLNILNATVTDGTNVLLTVASGGAGQYVLVASTNLVDATSTANHLGRTNAATIGLRISIPIDTDWKYNNLGQDLQAAWHAISYAAESTWSNGVALIYQEGSALPGPKNTQLALTSPTTGSFVTNFYFRKALPLATGATNATLSIRHIIDDGVVFYVNDAEFHRFNMAAGAVTATTFANVSVDNADWAGPFNSTVTTLTGGANELAAEVHQINAGSSDFVFGAQIDINSASVVIVNTNLPPPPRVAPKLVVKKLTNPLLSISWTNQPPYTSVLEATTNLVTGNTNWITVSTNISLQGNVSTYTNNVLGGSKTFYRVRVN